MKARGTAGAFGVLAPRRVTALGLGVGQGPTLETCHALAVILIHRPVKVKSRGLSFQQHTSLQ